MLKETAEPPGPFGTRPFYFIYTLFNVDKLQDDAKMRNLQSYNANKEKKIIENKKHRKFEQKLGFISI